MSVTGGLLDRDSLDLVERDFVNAGGAGNAVGYDPPKTTEGPPRFGRAVAM
jgi:hypothetical protein